MESASEAVPCGGEDFRLENAFDGRCLTMMESLRTGWSGPGAMLRRCSTLSEMVERQFWRHLPSGVLQSAVDGLALHAQEFASAGAPPWNALVTEEEAHAVRLLPCAPFLEPREFFCATISDQHLEEATLLASGRFGEAPGQPLQLHRDDGFPFGRWRLRCRGEVAAENTSEDLGMDAEHASFLRSAAARGELSRLSPERILAVEPGAADEERKQAYRSLSRRLHPDKAGDDPNAAQVFIALKEAFDALADLEAVHGVPGLDSSPLFSSSPYILEVLDEAAFEAARTEAPQLVMYYVPFCRMTKALKPWIDIAARQLSRSDGNQSGAPPILAVRCHVDAASQFMCNKRKLGDLPALRIEGRSTPIEDVITYPIRTLVGAQTDTFTAFPLSLVDFVRAAKARLRVTDLVERLSPAEFSALEAGNDTRGDPGSATGRLWLVAFVKDHCDLSVAVRGRLLDVAVHLAAERGADGHGPGVRFAIVACAPKGSGAGQAGETAAVLAEDCAPLQVPDVRILRTRGADLPRASARGLLGPVDAISDERDVVVAFAAAEAAIRAAAPDLAERGEPESEASKERGDEAPAADESCRAGGAGASAPHGGPPLAAPLREAIARAGAAGRPGVARAVPGFGGGAQLS